MISLVAWFFLWNAKCNDVDLSVYKGKVVLILNVAYKCGLTNRNYEELNQIYLRYKEQGFVILAFPCNQFGAQMLGSKMKSLLTLFAPDSNQNTPSLIRCVMIW